MACICLRARRQRGCRQGTDTPNLYVGETARTVLERLGTHLTTSNGEAERYASTSALFGLTLRGTWSVPAPEGRAPQASEAGRRAAKPRLHRRQQDRGRPHVRSTARKSAKPRQVGDGDDAQRFPGGGRVRGHENGRQRRPAAHRLAEQEQRFAARPRPGPPVRTGGQSRRRPGHRTRECRPRASPAASRDAAYQRVTVSPVSSPTRFSPR